MDTIIGGEVVVSFVRARTGKQTLKNLMHDVLK